MDIKELQVSIDKIGKSKLIRIVEIFFLHEKKIVTV